MYPLKYRNIFSYICMKSFNRFLNVYLFFNGISPFFQPTAKLI